jgi:hypothetical protein
VSGAELIWFHVGGELELHLRFERAAPLSQHFCLRVESGLDSS